MIPFIFFFTPHLNTFMRLCIMEIKSSSSEISSKIKKRNKTTACSYKNYFGATLWVKKSGLPNLTNKELKNNLINIIVSKPGNISYINRDLFQFDCTLLPCTDVTQCSGSGKRGGAAVYIWGDGGEIPQRTSPPFSNCKDFCKRWGRIFAPFQ